MFVSCLVKQNKEFILLNSNNQYTIVFKSKKDILNQTFSSEQIIFFGGQDEFRNICCFCPYINNYLDLQHYIWNKDTNKTNITLIDAYNDISETNVCLDLNKLFLSCFKYADKGVYCVKENDCVYEEIKRLFDIYSFIYNDYKSSVSQKDVFLCNEIDNDLCKSILGLENNKIPLNTNYVKFLKSEVNKNIEEYISNINKLAGVKFNINSTKELSFVLKSKGILNSGISQKDLTFDYTNTGFLLFKYINDYRKLSLYNEQYVKPLFKASINEGIGRFKYKIYSVPTGRICSCKSMFGNSDYFTNINMQSIPKASISDNLNIRKCFIPNKDCYWVTFDVKAQEVRTASYLYNIQKIKSIGLDDDIYEEIGKMMPFFDNKSMSPIQHRNMIKVITLGIIYGLSNYGITRQLNSNGIFFDTNIDYRKEFFKIFPEIEEGQKRTLWYAHAIGGIYTLTGRFRKINFTQNDKTNMLSRNNRIALNTVIQGFCGDIMRLIINNVEKKLSMRYKEEGFLLLNTIHDEINVSIPKKPILFEKIKNEILSIIKKPIIFLDDYEFGCKVSIKESWFN